MESTDLIRETVRSRQASFSTRSAKKKPNAPGELLPEAGATQERTLFPVSSRPLFGSATACSTLPTLVLQNLGVPGLIPRSTRPDSS
jgi:hypothetical protein